MTTLLPSGAVFAFAVVVACVFCVTVVFVTGVLTAGAGFLKIKYAPTPTIIITKIAIIVFFIVT